MIGIVDGFFFGLHCSNFLSQSEICATKHHKIFCTVGLPSTMSAIVTEIILIFWLVLLLQNIFDTLETVLKAGYLLSECSKN